MLSFTLKALVNFSTLETFPSLKKGQRSLNELLNSNKCEHCNKVSKLIELIKHASEWPSCNMTDNWQRYNDRGCTQQVGWSKISLFPVPHSPSACEDICIELQRPGERWHSSPRLLQYQHNGHSTFLRTTFHPSSCGGLWSKHRSMFKCRQR